MSRHRVRTSDREGARRTHTSRTARVVTHRQHSTCRVTQQQHETAQDCWFPHKGAAHRWGECSGSHGNGIAARRLFQSFTRMTLLAQLLHWAAAQPDKVRNLRLHFMLCAACLLGCPPHRRCSPSWVTRERRSLRSPTRCELLGAPPPSFPVTLQMAHSVAAVELRRLWKPAHGRSQALF